MFKMKSSKGILFCALDIGGRMELYSSYLKEKYPDRRIKTFAKYKLAKKHYQTSYDYHFNYVNQPLLIQYLISAVFLLYSLFRFKVFYIISGENILTRKLLPLELKLYKLFNKTVIMHFVGGDVRNSGMLREKDEGLVNPNHEKSMEPEQSEFQYKLCRLAEKYAQRIIVATPDLIRFFNRKVDYIPVFIDIAKFRNELSNIEVEKKDSNKVVVLHAPSNSSLKGSRYINEILQKLESTEDLEAIVTTDKDYKKTVNPPYTVSKYELLKLYQLSDAVIDQLVIGWYGMQSIEALLSNNITICLIEKDLMNYVSDNCPIRIITDHKQLESKILGLKKSEVQDQQKVREWVEKNHTIENNQTINQLFDSILN